MNRATTDHDPKEIIAAQQREIAMLRAHAQLAADNVGDWRELHQWWQRDFLRAERYREALEKIRTLDVAENRNSDEEDFAKIQDWAVEALSGHPLD